MQQGDRISNYQRQEVLVVALTVDILYGSEVDVIILLPKMSIPDERRVCPEPKQLMYWDSVTSCPFDAKYALRGPKDNSRMLLQTPFCCNYMASGPECALERPKLKSESLLRSPKLKH